MSTSYEFCYQAAAAGNLEALIALHGAGKNFIHVNYDDGKVHDSMYYALDNNHFNCVKYLFENGCAWHQNTTSIIAKNGNLEMLIFAHKNGCEWDNNASYFAAKHSHLECYKYIYQNRGAKYPSWDMTAAAATANMEFLQYFHELGIPVDKQCTSNAMASGSLECLQYVVEVCGAKWDPTTTSKAINLDCLIYAHKNGCPWDSETTKRAAEHGHADILSYALNNGCAMHPDTTLEAVKVGSLECLKIAHERGCKSSSELAVWCAEKGFLDCLKYIYDNGIKFSHASVTDAVAVEEHIDCFEYCFQVCKNPEKFWKKSYDHLIDKIDFTKPVWQALYTFDLSKNKKLKAKIDP